MSDVIDAPDEAEPELIECCEFCGCAIEDLEELIHLRASDLVTQWELADSRDAWRHTGDPAPPASVRNSDISGTPANAPRPYRTTPQTTIDAFFYLVRTEDVGRLKAWLADRPKDAPYLLALLEGTEPC